MADWKIIRENSCDSTNTMLKNLKSAGKIANKTVIMSGFQTKGRGQSENTWHSDPDMNLLCSFFITPGLPVEKHFLLTIIASLSIHDLLNIYGIDSKIKWPNDMYVGNKKIAGILIENSLMRDIIVDSVIGIGLNVNQTNFPDWVPNPVSMKLLSGNNTDLNNVLKNLVKSIDNTLNDFFENKQEDLFHRYTQLLFNLKSWGIFNYDGKYFNGRIHGILPDGRLIVESESGQMLQFLFGEVKYVF